MLGLAKTIPEAAFHRTYAGNCDTVKVVNLSPGTLAVSSLFQSFLTPRICAAALFLLLTI
jgi:hypothetical protein